MNRRCGHFLAALIAAAGAGAHAQVVPVYENDFESPNVTSCDASSFQSSGFTTSYNGTGVPPATFQQVNTADRLCVAQPVAAGPYYDPAGTAGKFTGGFVRHNDYNWVESWATTFDPKGQPFLNVSIDWAMVQLLAQKQFDPTAAQDVVLRFFCVPAGQTMAITDAGGGAPANVSGVAPPTALQTSPFTVQPPPNQATNPNAIYTFYWQTQRVTVPLSTCPAGSQVGMVAHIAGGNTYMAFDNLRVTASATPGGVAPAAVPVNAPLALLGAVLGLGWLGARRLRP